MRRSAKYIYGDEVAKWNEDVFNMLKSRLDKPYSCFDGSLNPEHPTHWLKKFIDSDADIYLQEYTIFDNSFLSKEFVQNLCNEYEGTIYYDRLILGKWVRAEGAIYRRFADNPKDFCCQIVDEINPDVPIRQFLKSQLWDITIGIDFGGNKSGHAFFATAKTKNYVNLIALKSERYFGEYDSNDLDRLAIEFAQSVFDLCGKVDFVYWDNAETVLGRGIKRAFEKTFPETNVRPARKNPYKTVFAVRSDLWARAGSFMPTVAKRLKRLSVRLCGMIKNLTMNGLMTVQQISTALTALNTHLKGI